MARAPRSREAPAAFDVDDSTPGRIVRAAREQLHRHGYHALTMEGLAHELGMSKKTLYLHFAGKHEIVTAIIDVAGQTIRRQVEAVLADPASGFTARLRDVMAIVGAQWGQLTPSLLREFERFAPAILQRLAELRQRNIPMVIARVLRLGIAQGFVRKDLDVDFAVHFWLQSLNGLVLPDTLEQLGLTPREAFDKGVRLFFWAVLTDTGRADFPKPRRKETA